MAMLDPRAEWRQMYRETWHLQRDFLYDPNHHGLDLGKIQEKYQPYLDGLASRNEFTYLSNEMLGEVQIGHMFVGGPRRPPDAPKPGLLAPGTSVRPTSGPWSGCVPGADWSA